MAKRPETSTDRSTRRRQARASSRPAAARLPGWAPPALAAAALVALVFAAFSPALSAGFVNLDDDVYVSENPQVLQGLTPSSIVWAWTSHYQGYQIPLTWMSLMLDADLFGTGPGGFHLTNILLHAGGAVLLMLALRRATGSLWRSALAAALWAVHPLRAESVSWVTERKDELAGLFGLAALYVYVRYAQAPPPDHAAAPPGSFGAFVKRARDSGRWRYALVVALYCLSLLSKPQLILSLPVALWLLDWWPLDRMRGGPEAPAGAPGATAPRQSPWALAVEKGPLILAAALAVAANAWSEYRAGPFLGDLPVGWAARLANVPVAPLRYLGKMFEFGHLAPLYPLPPVWHAAPAAASATLLLAITALAFRQRRRRPWLAVGWFWFLVALAPGLTPPPGLLGISIADRFTWFPAVGLSLVAVWSVSDSWLRTSTRRAVAGAAAAACLAALVGFSRAQAGYWHDSATLFRHTLAVTEGNWLAHHDLARELADRGRDAEALEQFRECLRINPGYSRGWGNEAILLNRMARWAEAVACTDHALSLTPNDVQARVSRATALESLGRHAEVVRECEAALRLDPGSAEAHNFLGIALVELGQRDRALPHFRRAMELDPGYVAAGNNLAWALHKPPATAAAGPAGRD